MNKSFCILNCFKLLIIKDFKNKNKFYFLNYIFIKIKVLL